MIIIMMTMMIMMLIRRTRILNMIILKVEARLWSLRVLKFLGICGTKLVALDA